MPKLMLVDGHSILNRAFYALPLLTNSKGIHTNAVYGFINILNKFIETENPDALTVAFDVHAPTFRHKMFKEYKGTRKPMAPELKEQVPMIKDLLKAMEITVVEKEGLEADDILGTIAFLAEERDYDVTIVSGDRDLLQLATNKIKISIPKTKREGTFIEDYYAKDVEEAYGVTPTEFIDVKALWGDSSDNIPGVPGIGEKTAISIIKEYKTVENAYANADSIKPPRASTNLKEYYDQALLSKDLATIRTRSDIEFDIENAAIKDFYTAKAFELCKEWEIKSLLKYFDIDTSISINQPRSIINVSSIEEAFSKLNNINNANIIGLAINEKEPKDEGYSFAICCDNDVAVVSHSDIEKAINYILDNTKAIIATGDIKRTIKLCENTEEFEAGRFFDITLGWYLINPNRSSYELESNESDICLQALECENEYKIVHETLEREGLLNLYNEIELPLSFVLVNMEKRGILLQKDELAKYNEMLSENIVSFEEEIYKKCGNKFNINSPKQLGEQLFEKMGIPGGKKTKTGYSTAADVLEKLAKDHPVINDILLYRQYSKLKSTYAEGLMDCVAEDGRVHTTFQQKVTATGRLSSTDPNLQNIPIRTELGRLIRKVFVPKDGYVFVDADYSQIELRVLAHMSGDENLINAYKENKDIHRSTASRVFHIPFDEVTDIQRSNAKAVNFGIVYGISSFGLGQDLNITRKEAQSYIDEYFLAYPELKEYLDNQVKQAKETGVTYTLYNRKRPIPELKSSNFMQRSFGERIAMNSPIQGSAADIIKIAMIKVENRLKDERLESKLILQVHDELLIEAKKEEIEIVKQILEEEMTNAVSLKVPLVADVHTGENWYDAK